MRTTQSWANLVSVLVAGVAIVWAGQSGGVHAAPMENEADLIAVLTGDTPSAEKAMACKKLAVFGSDACVPELARLLPDPQLASWARIALEAIPGETADEALRTAADSLTGNLLIGVINSIGIRRDASGVELLTARLKGDDPDVAIAAAIALGNIGTSDAAQPLRDALASTSAELRAGVAEGCILCAERALKDGDDARAKELYDQIRQADVPRQRKIEATRGAILARKQDGVPLLIEQLRGEDAGLVQIALSTAREIPGGDIDKALAAEVDKLPPERAALVITAMTDRPKTVDLAAVLKAAGQGPKPVRLAAITALGRVGNATCLATLLEAAIEPDSDIGQAAQTALAELPGDTVNQDIVDRLPKSQGKMYRLLIELIGQRRIEAIAALVKALDQQDAGIRGAALTSLGSTVTPKTLSVLITQVITPKYAEDKPAALQALKTAAVRMPDREACATELAQALTRASGTTKDELLEILSEVGGMQALQTIGAAAKSNDPQMQDTGSRLLGRWSTLDAAPVLLDLAKTAPSDRYHVRAVRGYISLARRFAAMPEQQRLEICQNTLDVARFPADKKLVLDVLKLYPSVESLKLAAKAGQIAELKDDAALAALAIGAKINGKADQVRDALSRVDFSKLKIEITKAEYGAGDTQKDVTETVRDLARNRPVATVSSNYNTAFGGDPTPGTAKKLKVQYRIDGKSAEATFDENDLIVLPPPK